MIDYWFNNELQILEVTYSGDIYADDLIRYGEEIASNQELPKDVLRILTDVTAARYQIYPHENEKLREALKRHTARFYMVRAAFLQTRPRETALSLLFSQNTGNPRYIHKVFSERDAALNWLLIF